MAKILSLENNISFFDFSCPHRDYTAYLNRFYSSEIGRLYDSLPWKDIYKCVKKNYGDPRGRKSLFSLHGKVALMFLKSYTGFSDRKLVEHLNTDFSLQFFCHIYLHPDEYIKDFKIISKIRMGLSKSMDWTQLQKVLMGHWKGLLDNIHVGMCDATCYETDMRYPTDPKLLWESCEWTYQQMKRICKSARMRMPRNKYADQKSKFLAYQKRRKKTHKLTVKRKRSLLYLLDKLLNQLKEVLSQIAKDDHLVMPQRFFRRLSIIHKILIQQRQLFDGQPVENRIVSIRKDYIRPIVRGKETKRVEFGAKVNILQIDGINFIEHLSFEAFNESTRLQSTIHLLRQLTGKCTHIAADQIYATNANRSYCSKNGIYTSFTRKGKPGKLEDQRMILQSTLSKHRATRLEGSFGIEKNHFGLTRIRARTKPSEILWIYFAIHTANAVRISKRIHAQKGRAKAV